MTANRPEWFLAGGCVVGLLLLISGGIITRLGQENRHAATVFALKKLREL